MIDKPQHKYERVKQGVFTFDNKMLSVHRPYWGKKRAVAFASFGFGNYVSILNHYFFYDYILQCCTLLTLLVASLLLCIGRVEAQNRQVIANSILRHQ